MTLQMGPFNQVTRTRIILPRCPPDLLSRQRLLDLLYDLLDNKLVIIAAPAGYGKTSLLVDMAHQLELPVCWYTLDAVDQDPHRFITHFIASIAHCFPDFGRQSVATLQSTTQTSLDLDRLVTIIVNEIYAHIREYFVLVLDDYHLVDDNEEIGRFVNQFVQQVDENCHLVISSRTLLTLPDLPLLVARSRVGGLSFEELAFRADEIQALVLQNHHLTIPEAAAEELVRETEGWITGLLLSSQTMWQGMADRLRLARVSGVGLYDYLAQQVLEQQPAPIRDFLLRTSLLEEFDAELCEAVLGPAEEDWSSLIETVWRSNLFVLPVGDEETWPIGDQGMWLRYHHLFRDFLQTRLAQERPEEKDRILRRLASLYAGRKEWEKAHNLYRCLGDMTATTDLIEQASLSLVQGGRLMILAEWLDALPADILVSRPFLLSLRGLAAVMLGEVERGLSLLNRAEASARTADDRACLARVLVWRTIPHRFLGNYQASLVDAEEALALAEQDEGLRDVRAEALRARGISLDQLGRLDEAIECLEQALAACNALNDTQNAARLLMELGLAYMNAGRYDQALTCYNDALDYWQGTGNVTWQANLLNNLAVLHHLRGSYEQASLTFEEALVCASQSGYARMEAYILCGIGDLYATLDAADATLDAYYQARKTARRIDERFLLFYLDLADATQARSQGDLAQAYDLLDSARRLAQESGSDYEQGLCQLAAGRLALAKDHAPEAVAHLEEAAHRFDDGGQRVEGIRAYLYLAVAYHTAGQEQAALNQLEYAFRLASGLESRHPLVVAGREAKMLLKAIQSDPAFGRQVSQLLEQVVQFEQEIPALRRRLRQRASTVPFALPRLTIQALGKAQVMLDGKLVTSPEWRNQKRVRDLFFCLLAHPDGLTKEAAGIIFWPDSTPAQLKLQFKNTIYRLRSALGKEVVVFDENEGRYRFNRALDYEYDVEAFQQLLVQARSETEPGRQIAAYRAAIDLCEGPYLPEADGTWTWPERERLQRACLEATLQLASLHLEAREYGVTLEYCRRALAEDPCLEEAHRLAMRAHAALGNQAAVVRQFNRCRQTLLSEINAPPSSQTEALFEMLIR